jgi:cyclopropane fatty-acyl-phospholipid synthase-like methyltransferase
MSMAGSTDSDSPYDDNAAIAASVADGRHREIVGGLWDEIGALQFEFLKHHGLNPHDHLLDIGCDSLRGGVHFAAYLHPAHYWGIDSNKSLLDAGYNVELMRLGLTVRVPRVNLLCDDEFSFEKFGRSFDVAVAQSVFTHLSANRIRLCLSRLAQVMPVGAKLFVTYFEAPEKHPIGEPLPHAIGGTTSFAYKDPFHYRLSDIEEMVGDLPWRVAWCGKWNHPRDQRMLIIERLSDPHSVPNRETRALDTATAGSLPAGALHYRAYVGPPDRYDFMGASQFALLFTLGLREHHSVLDFGCGSLRLGRLLIPYLLPGRYFGIDPHRWLIEDALSRELGWSAARVKNPSFAYNDDFRCDVFGRRFDFIVAQSIFTHCGHDLSERLFDGMSNVLEATGVVVFSVIESAPEVLESVARGWVYPECVSHRRETILNLCASAGLSAKRLPWYHPGAVWYVAARDAKRLPTQDEMSVLSGSVLFDPQFEAGRPARVGRAETQPRLATRSARKLIVRPAPD